MEYEKAPMHETIWRWGIHQEKLRNLKESSQETYEVIELHGVIAFADTIPLEAKVSNACVADLLISHS